MWNILDQGGNIERVKDRLLEMDESGMAKDWTELVEELELLDLIHQGQVGCPASTKKEYIERLTEYRHKTDLFQAGEVLVQGVPTEEWEQTCLGFN